MGAQIADHSLRELGGIYEGVRKRLVGIVTEIDDPASVPVPACPGWSVHDVVAHLAGSCADVMAMNLAGLASDDWTRAQVEARRDTPFAEVVAEWEQLGPKIAAIVDDFPGYTGNQSVSDLTVHEHDIRGAVGSPGARDSDGVNVTLDFLLTVIVHGGMCAQGLGPLEVRAGDRSWVAGSAKAGDGTFDLDAMRNLAFSGERPSNDGETPVAILTAEPFELFRAFTGRRSAAQIAGYDWSGQAERFLPMFDVTPFSTRADDLIE
jgi:uncharacterized protein (TIGR03083 family)